MSGAIRVSVRVWMQRLRADPDVAKVRLSTLMVIGTYMNTDGSNAFVSEAKVASDVGISPRAAREHIAWARENDYLRRTARGHRKGDGEVAESAYEAITPDLSISERPPVEKPLNRKIGTSQPEDREASTGRSDDLNRKIQGPQPEDSDIAYKEDQVLDQELDQKKTKSAARESAKPPPSTQKPAADMLPMPVAVPSRPRTASRPAPKAPPAEPDTRPAALAAISEELVREFDAGLPRKLDRRSRHGFLRDVDELLGEGFTRDEVRNGMLLLFQNQHRCGLGMLRTFIRQAIAAAAMPSNVHPLNRRAGSDAEFAREAAIAAGADPHSSFANTGFFATTSADNVIDGQVVNGETG